MEITKVSWMSEEKFDDYKSVREQFQNMCSKYKDHAMMKKFPRNKALKNSIEME